MKVRSNSQQKVPVTKTGAGNNRETTDCPMAFTLPGKQMQATTTPIEYQSDDEQLAALRVPFPVSEVKTREQGGATLNYYEAHTIQQRLLDVLGTGLSIKTKNVVATVSAVNIETVLEITWVSGKTSRVSGWGSSDILLRSNGKVANDPYKSAATDSIKVAASKLGVAAELYDSDYRERLAAMLKAQGEAEARREFLTCQGCHGEIRGGERRRTDGSVVEMTAEGVANATRKRFGLRYCIPCGEQADRSGRNLMKGSPQTSPQTSDVRE